MRSLADWLWAIGAERLASVVHEYARLREAEVDRTRAGLRQWKPTAVFERLCVECAPSVKSCGQGACTRCGSYGWLTAVQRRPEWTL